MKLTSPSASFADLRHPVCVVFSQSAHPRLYQHSAISFQVNRSALVVDSVLLAVS